MTPMKQEISWLLMRIEVNGVRIHEFEPVTVVAGESLRINYTISMH